MRAAIEVSVEDEFLQGLVVFDRECNIIMIGIDSHLCGEFGLRFGNEADGFDLYCLREGNNKNYFTITVRGDEALFIKSLLVRFDDFATGVLVFLVEAFDTLEEDRGIKVIG